MPADSIIKGQVEKPHQNEGNYKRQRKAIEEIFKRSIPKE